MTQMAGRVWFYILPTNEVSEAIVNDSRNENHVVITDGAGVATSKMIQVIFKDSLKPYCILSFGRGTECDIRCDPPGTAFGREMAQSQCSFRFHNRCLIIQDHSGRATTTISPVHLDSPGKWHMDRLPRQRAIPEYGDWHISMGPTTFLLRFCQGMHNLDSLIISLPELTANR